MTSDDAIYRSTFRKIRDYYPLGSAPTVVAHAKLRLQYGKRPTLGYKHVRSPRQALRLALRDQVFYEAIHDLHDTLQSARLETAHVIHAETQPASFGYITRQRDRIKLNVDWQRDMTLVAQHAMISLLIEDGVCDIIRCFEMILDRYYGEYNRHIIKQEREFRYFHNHDPDQTRKEVYCELVGIIFLAGYQLTQKLTEGCVAPQQLDIAASYVN